MNEDLETELERETARARTQVFVRRLQRASFDIVEATLDLVEAVKGPMAPRHRRPKRIAKKIAARGGRLHHSIFS